MTMICPRCGTRRIGQFRFCRSCGLDFDAPLENPAVPSDASPGAPSGDEPTAARRPWWRQPATIPAIVVGAFVLLGAIANVAVGQRGPAGSPRLPAPTPSTGAPTIEASAGPTVEPTPEASAEPIEDLNFAPITLKGRANEVATFSIPTGAPAIATITNRGGSTFSVSALDANGAVSEVPVKAAGSYTGTVLFDANEGRHTVAFEVVSGGSWTIVIKPITAARAWTGGSRIAGKGDDVLLVNPVNARNLALKASHPGAGEFLLQALGVAPGPQLLIDRTGPYSGPVVLPAGTTHLIVSARGTWALQPS